MAARRKKSTGTTKSAGVKLQRLEAQTRVICTFNRIIFAVMALVLGLAVVASALPQKRKLQDLEFQLARVLDEEEQVQAEKEHREIEYRAMKEDPEFLELKARDRLNLHRAEERIFRIRRTGD
jgi:hypothetical protein